MTPEQKKCIVYVSAYNKQFYIGAAKKRDQPVCADAQERKGTLMKEFIQIHPNDNVAVALSPLPSGKEITLGGNTFQLREEIPLGHKFTLLPLKSGTPVIKYGCPIGTLQEDCPAGVWVHTHNLKTGLGELLTYTYAPQPSPLTAENARYFQGYRRKDGKVGIRNGIWIIPTVGCVNNVATAIERQAQQFVGGSPHFRILTAAPRWETIRSIPVRSSPI